MEPGKDLDRLIAEKVMGWRLRKGPRGKVYGLWPPDADFDLWGTSKKWPIPRFSADPSLAFKITEKFKEFQMLKVFFPEPPITRYVASLKRGCEIEAPTMAHAICLAALRASQ
jgi:hypothetical protein